ncbi:hypothetical protein D3C71_1277110 [compost metagenome]
MLLRLGVAVLVGLGRQTVDGRAAEGQHTLARQQQARLAAVDVLAVGLQHQEHVDEVAGLDLVAHAHDFVSLDCYGALAFGYAQGQARNQLTFEQRRAFAQVDYRDAAGEGCGLFEGPCRVDRQLFHA